MFSKRFNEILLYTFSEIEDRLDRSNLYDIVSLSAKCRQLLVDDGGWINHLSGEYGLQLSFEIPPDSPLANPTQSSGGGAPLPAQPLKLDLRGFLEHRCLANEHVSISVREVIKYLANKEGGVHKAVSAGEFIGVSSLDTPTDDIRNPILARMSEIAAVVSRAVAPFKRALTSTGFAFVQQLQVANAGSGDLRNIVVFRAQGRTVATIGVLRGGKIELSVCTGRHADDTRRKGIIVTVQNSYVYQALTCVVVSVKMDMGMIEEVTVSAGDAYSVAVPVEAMLWCYVMDYEQGFFGPPVDHPNSATRVRIGVTAIWDRHVPKENLLKARQIVDAFPIQQVAEFGSGTSMVNVKAGVSSLTNEK